MSKPEGVNEQQAGETRCRILRAARELFSRFGFAGTSVRQIAKQSDVNLAAVNYHFKNKENLLWEVLGESYQQGEAMVQGLATKAQNLEELALSLFDHFVEHKSMIRNTMKLILTDDLTPPDTCAFMQRARPVMGPPGSLFIAEFIQREVNFDLNPRGMHWGVKTIFGPIFHWATMCSSAHVEKLSEENPLLTSGSMREDVRLLARSTLSYLNAHPEIFGKN